MRRRRPLPFRPSRHLLIGPPLEGVPSSPLREPQAILHHSASFTRFGAAASSPSCLQPGQPSTRHPPALWLLLRRYGYEVLNISSQNRVNRFIHQVKPSHSIRSGAIAHAIMLYPISSSNSINPFRIIVGVVITPILFRHRRRTLFLYLLECIHRRCNNNKCNSPQFYS